MNPTAHFGNPKIFMTQKIPFDRFPQTLSIFKIRTNYREMGFLEKTQIACYRNDTKNLTQKVKSDSTKTQNKNLKNLNNILKTSRQLLQLLNKRNKIEQK